MKRILLFSALFAACGQDPIIVPVRNLDRPSDMAFACLSVSGAPGPEKVSGRPMAECHPPGTAHRPVDVKKPRVLGTFGFVPNTGRGELAVVDLDANLLVDLDPAQPGFGTLPIGPLPESLAASQDGCRLVTANRGSCDLTFIDTARLMTGTFQAKPPATEPGPVAERIAPRTASGRLLSAAPHEVVFLPQPLKGADGAENLCGAAAYAGNGKERVPWRALASFPGCDLVALLDLPSGRVVSAVYVRADAVEDAGAEPICPAECGSAAGAGTGRMLVGSLALLPDGKRVYVGGAGAPFLMALDVSAEGLKEPPGGGRIALAEAPGGVTRLRLSVDPFAPADDGALGRFLGARGEFLYAIALDGSVRVVDVGRRRQGDGKERECDVNIDPQAVADIPGASSRGCFAITDDPQATRLPRVATARGPGIRIPATVLDLPPPVPRDVAFASVVVPVMSSQGLDGHFGFLLASTGNTYVVNVDPTVRTGDLTPPLSHSFRNAATSLGPPSLTDLPDRTFTQTDVAFPTRVTVGQLQGPRLDATPSESQMDPRPSFMRFADPRVVIPQGWTVVWEGVLPGSSSTAGRVTGARADPASAGVLDDLGGDFCETGTQALDIVVLVGCVEDADCLPRGTQSQVCRQASPGARGLCFPAASRSDEELMRRCARHVTSRMRYEVVQASKTRLELGLKLDEVPKPPLDPMTSLDACAKDEDCAVSPPTFAGFECLQVRTGEPKRCVKRCIAPRADDRACRVGHVCEDVSGSLVGPLCVEGPPLDATCWPQTASYRVQAGKSFLVTGSAPPLIRTAREEGGRCVPDDSRNPLLSNRIPLAAPHCSNVEDGTKTSDALAQAPAAAQGWGNPCLFRSPNGDAAEMATKALFANHQFRFVLTNLDQYAGDGLAIRFNVGGGFVPMVVEFPGSGEIIVSLGVRIVTGPGEAPALPETVTTGVYAPFPYLYVVDQGRAFSTPGGRGQVLRFNPRPPNGLPPRFESNLHSDPSLRFHIQ